jgi:hypothetical protein
MTNLLLRLSLGLDLPKFPALAYSKYGYALTSCIALISCLAYDYVKETVNEFKCKIISIKLKQI